MSVLKQAYKYKLHHLLVWALLFAGWYYFRAKDFPGTRIALEVTAIKIMVLAALTYFSSYVLVPKLLYRKKYLLFSVIYVVVIFSAGLLKLSIIIHLIYPRTSPFDNFKTRVYDNIIPLFLLVSTGVAFRLIRDYLVSQRRLTEIAKEKAETELKFLKSQINPHFLFNSLNSIYFLIDKQNTAARNTLLQFSDLLRYQLYECNTDHIEIEKEIAYLNDFIRLQQLRKDHHYEIKVAVGENVQEFRIVPLLMLPIVENAFKHISHHSDDRNFIHIDLSRSNGTFHFTVENSKEVNPMVEPGGGGIGLNNVKRRLDLLYAGKHSLQVEDKDGTFKVNMQLDIDHE
jgi:two-component system, LytTR family, sensor kinase